MKPRQQLTKGNACGFTFIEIIAVLLLLGILAAIAISKSSSTDAYSTFSEAAILKGHLRFAQLKAMSDVSTTWGLQVTSTSYTLQTNGAAAAISLPGEESNTHTFSSVTASAQAITFDDWGSPGATTLNVALTGGDSSQTITVTRNTGFIP